MTPRTQPPPNVIGVAFWTCGGIAVLVAILLWSHPELWPWVAAVWGVSGLLGLGIVAAEARTESAAKDDRIEALEDVLAALDAENARLHADAEWFRIVQHDDAPRLRVVPTQRDGDHDDLTALMRATREDRP